MVSFGRTGIGIAASFRPDSSDGGWGQAVLDGEIVHLDSDGKPRFYDLMRRRIPQHYYAFDLLWQDGRDLRDFPLIK
jgi:ATP-dependent DNA ligase